jgi:hypothetical protein
LRNHVNVLLKVLLMEKLCDWKGMWSVAYNALNSELNPIYHLPALLGAHHIVHVSRIRVNPYPAIVDNMVGS